MKSFLNRVLSSDTFKAAWQNFIALSLAFLILLLLIRWIEYFYLTSLHNLPANSLQLAFTGLKYDLLIFLKISALLLLPFLLLFKLRVMAARIFYGTVAVLLAAGYAGLVQYFSVSLVPLGADFFGYTLDEMTHTVSASGNIGWLSLWPVVVLILLFVFSFRLMLRLNFNKFLVSVYAGILMLALFFSTIPMASAYASDMEFYLVNNKLGYFLTKSYQYLNRGDEEEENHTAYYFDDEKVETASVFLDKNYPFLRTNLQQNVLGPFFNLNATQKPNVVFLIVESLGRAYSGEGAYLGSFTPFLDSLSQHSLYFPNFLSTSGRTFGVLPGLFGALPFAEKGFLERGNNVPAHLTLLSLLKAKGYQTYFNYGGDAHFDNMDIFLRRQNVDYLLDEKKFGAGYQKLPANQGGFSWGYGDREIYRKSLQELEDKSQAAPRLEIYLTMVTHDPFLIPKQGYYTQQAAERIKSFQLPDAKKQEYQKYIKPYATLLYADDAIRYFLQEYAKRPDFKNTIFIITGDHRMPEIPVVTKIDRFHVPLIIYSPLLKRTATIPAVSSHFDVTPSLLSLLSNQYQFKTPTVAAWLGNGLDTARTFRNIHALPLMRNKNELLDYVDRNYFLADGELFQIQNNLNIVPVSDETKARELTDKFAEFRLKNKQTFTQNKLIPDSLLKYIK